MVNFENIANVETVKYIHQKEKLTYELNKNCDLKKVERTKKMR